MSPLVGAHVGLVFFLIYRFGKSFAGLNKLAATSAANPVTMTFSSQFSWLCRTHARSHTHSLALTHTQTSTRKRGSVLKTH